MTTRFDNTELRSTLRSTGEVELALMETPVAPPGDDEVVVEMQAAPLHPVDLAMLLARGDPATARRDQSVTLLQVAEPVALAQRTRWDVPLQLGTEGAGKVVAAGKSAPAQALIGSTVALWGGGTFARYRTIKAAEAMALPDGVSAIEGASAHLNPLTALGMIEVLRGGGHRAMVHTAAASTIGQILCRVCREEGIPIVNVVRRPEQAELLQSIGAEVVCDSSAASFESDLAEALRATDATIAFDATGGGNLASRILHHMEMNISSGKPFDHSGSSIRKQVYVYGTLDPAPLVFLKDYGWSWDVSGYVVFDLLARIGPERTAQLKQRIAQSLKSTFAVPFARAVTLEQLMGPEVLRDANRRATGEKYIVELGAG